MPNERKLEFGLFVDPSAANLGQARQLARRADELGLELLGVQDHPYQARFLDTWMLMATLLAETRRIRVFPDVANLPLRGPAMIAKQAASLDLLSGGRFELGLGAGGFWDAIAAMGGPKRSPGDAFDALEEAVQIIRRFWSGERGLTFEGRHYKLQGVHAGPPPAHPIGIWIGAARPRSLNMIGRLADGWVPSLNYIPPAVVPDMNRQIDEGASQAGRDPRAIRRIYNVSGTIAETSGAGTLEGPPKKWVDALTEFAVKLRFDTFILWPTGEPMAQLERFAQEVVPGVREAVTRAAV